MVFPMNECKGPRCTWAFAGIMWRCSHPLDWTQGEDCLSRQGFFIFKIFKIRIWKLWFSHMNYQVFMISKSYTVAQFVSNQCFIDDQVLCHFLVLLVVHFKNKYPHLPIPLHLIDSDSCEIFNFFEKIGGMVGLERVYDFDEVVNTTNALNCVSGVEYGENGHKFNQIHNNMENVWEKLHPMANGEVPTNLSDYNLVSTNEQVVGALKEGFRKAQMILHGLYMAPSPGANANNSV